MDTYPFSAPFDRENAPVLRQFPRRRFAPSLELDSPPTAPKLIETSHSQLQLSSSTRMGGVSSYGAPVLLSVAPTQSVMSSAVLDKFKMALTHGCCTSSLASFDHSCNSTQYPMQEAKLDSPVCCNAISQNSPECHLRASTKRRVIDELRSSNSTSDFSPSIRALKRFKSYTPDTSQSDFDSLSTISSSRSSFPGSPVIPSVASDDDSVATSFWMSAHKERPTQTSSALPPLLSMAFSKPLSLSGKSRFGIYGASPSFVPKHMAMLSSPDFLDFTLDGPSTHDSVENFFL